VWSGASVRPGLNTRARLGLMNVERATGLKTCRTGPPLCIHVQHGVSASTGRSRVLKLGVAHVERDLKTSTPIL
jgi:hypothetical protein